MGCPMGQVIVRDLDDGVIAALEARAAKHGKSLEQELREILVAAAKPSREELLAELDRIRAMTRPGPRPLAEDIIREDRDLR